MARVFKTSEAQTIIEAMTVVTQLKICMRMLMDAQQKEYEKREPMSEAVGVFEEAMNCVAKAQDEFDLFMERIKDEGTTKENP